MKLVWQSSLMFNSFVVLPAALVFVIYSIGAAVIQGRGMLSLWALASFLAGIVFQAVFGALSE